MGLLVKKKKKRRVTRLKSMLKYFNIQIDLKYEKLYGTLFSQHGPIDVEGPPNMRGALHETVS
jgi:hypothetical protein